MIFVRNGNLHESKKILLFEFLFQITTTTTTKKNMITRLGKQLPFELPQLPLTS